MTSRKVSPAIRLIVVAVAIGALTLIAGAMPAAAAPGSAGTAATQASLASACPADSLCLFEHRDFGGQILVIPAGTSIPNLHVFPCPGCNSKHSAGDGNWGDNMSSVVNNTSTDYCGYLHINYESSATDYTIFAGTSRASFSRYFNDEVSSYRPDIVSAPTAGGFC